MRKGGVALSFKFYKFCQSALITFITSLYACFMTGYSLFNFPWWGALIFSIVATIICFLPIISIFYPLLIGVFLILSCIGTFPGITFFFSIVIAVLHIVRMYSMLSFAKKNPQKSLEYDTAIRYGYKL